jgi:hypothetical protein
MSLSRFKSCIQRHFQDPRVVLFKIATCLRHLWLVVFSMQELPYFYTFRYLARAWQQEVDVIT